VSVRNIIICIVISIFIRTNFVIYFYLSIESLYQTKIQKRSVISYRRRSEDSKTTWNQLNYMDASICTRVFSTHIPCLYTILCLYSNFM